MVLQPWCCSPHINSFNNTTAPTWELLFADWTAAARLLHLHLPLIRDKHKQPEYLHHLHLDLKKVRINMHELKVC